MIRTQNTDRENPTCNGSPPWRIAGVVGVATFIFVLSLFLAAGPMLAADKDTEKTKKDSETKSTEAPTEDADLKLVLKDVYVIQIKDHKFIPATLVIPAKKKVKLRIENLDKTPEEFESYDLNREKIVGGGRKIIIFVGPLKPGTYKYFGEFNPKTAQGVIIAKSLEQ